MGAIYILINESFPDLIKIGYAEDVEKMIGQLNESAVTPFPFLLYATYEAPSDFAEKGIQRIVDRLMQGRKDDQVDLQERGFYSIEPEAVYQLLEDMAIIHGRTDQLQKYQETEDMLRTIERGLKNQDDESKPYRIVKAPGTRNKRFRFSMIGLKPGDMIQYKNDQNQSFRILNDREVEFEGKPYSLTALAMKIAGKPMGVQGTIYFTYKGEVLDKIRKRMEAEELAN